MNSSYASVSTHRKFFGDKAEILHSMIAEIQKVDGKNECF